MGLENHPCPECGRHAVNETDDGYECYSCGETWDTKDQLKAECPECEGQTLYRKGSKVQCVQCGKSFRE